MGSQNGDSNNARPNSMEFHLLEKVAEDTCEEGSAKTKVTENGGR
jgi:hypothetical protein